MTGTRPTGRDDFGQRGHAKLALWGEPEQPKRCGLRANLARSRIAQVVTARPEVVSAVFDGAYHSAGFGEAPQQAFFGFWPQGKI